MRTFIALLVTVGLAAGVSGALADDAPANAISARVTTPAEPICGVVRALRTAGGARLYFAAVPVIVVTHPLEKGDAQQIEYELDDKNRLGTFDANGEFQALESGIGVAVGDDVWARFSAESSCTLHVRMDGLEVEGVFSPPDVTPQKSRVTIAYEG
jgi:hypothetical protein